MSDKLVSAVMTMLATMDGYPSLVMPKSENEDLPPVAMSYAVKLSRLPDATLAVMLENVTVRYDKRPSVKALVEWAAEIYQGSVSAPIYLLLDGKTPDRPRLSGPTPTCAAGGALSVITDAARTAHRSGSPIPDAAKAVFRNLRERMAQDGGAAGRVIVPRADAGDWGLEYIRDGDKSERLPARWSESVARAKAAEVAEKYPHLTVRVWCASAVGSGVLA